MVQAGPVRNEVTQNGLEPDCGEAVWLHTFLQKRRKGYEGRLSKREHPKAVWTACAPPVASVEIKGKEEEKVKKRKNGAGVGAKVS